MFALNASAASPWLLAAVTLLTACSTKRNPDACFSDDDCLPGSTCNRELNACRAIPDAAPAGTCSAADSVCIEAAPEGWQGPVALYDGDSDEPPPACPDALPSAADSSGDFFSTGECECACEDATGVSCATEAPPRVWNATINLGRCVLPFGQTDPRVVDLPVDGTCVGTGDLDRSREVIYDDPGIDGGTCAPITTDTLAAGFGRTSRACGSDRAFDGSDCGDGLVCVPRFSERFRAGACVFREGDHDCPADTGYAIKVARFTGLSDERSCDCSCGAPDGNCGTTRLFVSCDTRIAVGPTLGNRECYEPQSGDLQYEGIAMFPSPSGSCEPARISDGEASPTGQVTYCCVP